MNYHLQPWSGAPQQDEYLFLEIFWERSCALRRQMASRPMNNYALSMNPNQIQSELDSMVATQAGLMAIVGSLMATHPQYERFQLRLTGLLEILLNGAAGITFTEDQRQQAREFVETLQQLPKAPPAIDPLQARLDL